MTERWPTFAPTTGAVRYSFSRLGEIGAVGGVLLNEVEALNDQTASAKDDCTLGQALKAMVARP